MSKWLTGKVAYDTLWRFYHFVDFTYIKILVMCSVFWAWFFFFFFWPLAMKLRNSASRKNPVSFPWELTIIPLRTYRQALCWWGVHLAAFLSVLSCVCYRSKVSLAKKIEDMWCPFFRVVHVPVFMVDFAPLTCMPCDQTVASQWFNDSKSRASCGNHLKSLKAHDSFDSLNDKNSAGSECNAGLANCIQALWARMPKLFRHCTLNFLCFKARRRQLFGGAHSKRQVYRLSWSKLLRWADHRNTCY